MHHSQLLRRRPRIDSATSAVKADPAAASVRHLVVVNIMNGGGINICHGAVIGKPALIPICAVVATPRVSIAVIDAAVVTNMRTPVTRVPVVVSVVVAPPGRRPERSYIRGKHPHPGDPIIAVARIIPVTGRPNIVVAGGGRLAVIGKGRRRFRSFDRLFIRGVLFVSLLVTRGIVVVTGKRCIVLRRGCKVLRRRRRDRRLRLVAGLVTGLLSRGQIAVSGVTVGNICGLIRWILRSLVLRLVTGSQGRRQYQDRNQQETSQFSGCTQGPPPARRQARQGPLLLGTKLSERCERRARP